MSISNRIELELEFELELELEIEIEIEIELELELELLPPFRDTFLQRSPLDIFGAFQPSTSLSPLGPWANLCAAATSVKALAAHRSARRRTLTKLAPCTPAFTQATSLVWPHTRQLAFITVVRVR
jgi:hypothetical protein